MILSTILLNILGIFTADDEARASINIYKSESLYTEDYKSCAIGHFSTKLLGEPLNCINDVFIQVALENLGAVPVNAISPDMTHFVREIKFNDPQVISAELVSNRLGQVIRIQARLNDELSTDEMRDIAKKISSIHGQPDVTPPNPQMPLWGWITSDGFEIRLHRDTITSNKLLSITQRQAHSTLRDLKTKTVGL
ncbi:hypothetical protein OTK49_00185 [Vibrio coralliirubri]|uniref:hypothetical protein n=1 Tax=Vibrio coralliirubri TaxID=1516159 RepID=UPI002285088D|nr:hypothetical protein [Vibrio coralliirubri]MCY9860958.1 hypothetical protein [Vibrio coralliirubri]